MGKTVHLFQHAKDIDDLNSVLINLSFGKLLSLSDRPSSKLKVIVRSKPKIGFPEILS